MNRRDFLKTAGKSVLGTGLGLLVLPEWAHGAAPSDQIVTGHIGVGGMGGGHVGWFLGHKDVRVDAVCDVDATRAAGQLRRVHGRYKDTRAKAYKDFREVLDRKDIDAISIGTPDHWRALIVTHAFQAAKDVYAEKPLCHNWREAQAMLTMGRRYARVFQLGTQIHSLDNYHRVVELVRSGVLGKIHTVNVWMGGGCGVRNYDTPPPCPPTLDYDMWLGPAPKRPYHPARNHFTFRYFLDYSGGVYADFWCHISDIAFWALQLGAPSTIVTRGELQSQGMYTAPKWVELDLDFPTNGIKYHWTTGRAKKAPGTVGGGIGCWFQGTKGQLVCDYGNRAVYLDGHESRDVHEVPISIPRSPGHQRNFIDCVKSRGLTESNLPYAVNMTQPMFFGRIALHCGCRTLKWDNAKGQFIGDDEANRLLGRVYREPWALPV